MPEAEKIALKGFCALRIWPVTANTEDTYTTGEMIRIPWAQSMTKAVNRSDNPIPADDTIYDYGNDFQYEEFQVTVVELPDSIEAKLSGAEAATVPGTGTLYRSTDNAPTFAMGYAGLLANGNYRMFKHYAAVCTNIQADMNTKGGDNSVTPYVLTFRNSARVADHGIRRKEDSTDGTFTWLDTIDNIPAP